MKCTKIFITSMFITGLAVLCLLSPHRMGAADSDTTTMPIPSVIQRGFKVWADKETSSYAFDVWKKGGLLEDDSKSTMLANYFTRLDRTVGNYKSYEIIDSKVVNQTSSIFYISVNFEHAAVYARFLVYRTDGNWVVQNMDFSTRPEAVMPWLAFGTVDYSGQ
jgi:hypothetical protein